MKAQSRPCSREREREREREKLISIRVGGKVIAVLAESIKESKK